jgi:hypothetical protein
MAKGIEASAMHINATTVYDKLGLPYRGVKNGR